jgi:uncharacterized protein YggT (Ycf19 family)
MTGEVKNVRGERTSDGKVRRKVVKQEGGARQALAARIIRISWILVLAVEAVLLLRFLLKLMAADPAVPVAGLIYGITDTLLRPFEGLTPVNVFEGVAVELTTLIAMLVYLLLGWLAVELIRMILKPMRKRQVETYEEIP